MADLLISYARDGEALADKLSTLLRQEGFSIWTEAAARGPIQERVGDVRASVVIWSDTSRVSEWIKAEANYARGQKKLVQASVDGEAPPMPFDAEAVAAMVDWTGDEGHPGWLKLRAQLEGLCRKRAPQPAAATAAAAVPDKAAAAPAPALARGGGGGLRTALAVLVGLAVVGAAFLWMRSGPPYGSEEASPPAASQPAPPPAAARPVDMPPMTASPATAPETPFAGEEGEEILPDTGSPPTGADEGTGPQVEPRPQIQQRPAPQVQQRPAQARPAPRGPGARINRRNSRTMRLFCERAGRGTPQCREFQRQLRNQNR